MSAECHFELVPLDCIECGAVTGRMGTCADVVHCPRCEIEFAMLNNDSLDTAQINVILAEHTPYIGTSEEGET